MMTWKDILAEPIEIQLFQAEIGVIVWCIVAIIRDAKRFIAEIRQP